MTNEDIAKLETYLSMNEEQLRGMIESEIMTDHSSNDYRSGSSKAFGKLMADLHRILCVEWHWCEKRKAKKYVDRSSLAISVFDAVTCSSLVVPVPLTLVAAYAVSCSLDNLCGCDEV